MKNQLIAFLIFLHIASTAIAQNDIAVRNNPYRYDTDYPTKEFHTARRAALRAALPDNSVAVFFSNPVRNRSGDGDFEYHQDPNFYYLTGLTEPDAVLLVFKETQDFDSIKTNEFLFLQERDAQQELWTGRILGTAAAKGMLGIKSIYKNTDFANFNFHFEKLSTVLCADLFALDAAESKGGLANLQKHFIELLVAQNIKKAAAPLETIMATLRQVKQPAEIALMRKAINISCQAHIELMKSVHPTMAEYQAQAIVEYVFKNNGAECEAYSSILGSGENSCVLHYESNRKQMNELELLLTDAGAEYHGYTADITRTIPVNGIFSEEQKAIYELVLQAQEAGIQECTEGNNFYAPHKVAVKIIQQGLLKLGITNTEADYRSYFAHATSHYLGLDVHDVGLSKMLVSGNIITVEPGIYIPEGSPCDKKWWNIGVRIEDDILITNGEPENLSNSVPRKVNEIEQLMKQKGFFEEQK